MSEVKPKFSLGDNVLVINTGDIGTINKIIYGKRNIGYRVTVDGKVYSYQEKYLELLKDEEQEILDALALEEYGNLNDFEIFNTWFRNKRPIEGGYYSYLSSKTIFNPYQFKPLSKFLSHHSQERLFIADEVGVGKTIEAGIILTELLARGRITRKNPVLIICPNSLGPKWVKEMKERFNLNFHLHDGNSLKNALLNALNGRFSEREMFSVVSIQLLRNEKYLDLVEKLNVFQLESVWSMVIIDEAHHMRNKNTESQRMGHLISNMTDMLIMMSATPLNLKDADLFYLMNILNPALYPDIQSFEQLLGPVKLINQIKSELLTNQPSMFHHTSQLLNQLAGLSRIDFSQNLVLSKLVNQLNENKAFTYEELASYERSLTLLNPLEASFTRTLKREAFQQKVVREVIKIPVNLTHEEKEFHDEVIRFSETLFLSKGGDESALGFVTNMLRRMVSSSIPATINYYNWAIENNMYISEKVDINNEELDYDENEVIGDESYLEQKELPESARKEYEHLVSKAQKIGDIDTKYDVFNKFINQLLASLENPQVIVFSFFIRTLDYLKKRLEKDGYKVGLISGQVPVQGVNGRYDIIDRFKDGEFNILLTSDVGGEGLDFQFAQALLNYDLPYNPMKVEQRIGRIDRFGQKGEKIFAASMYIENTVDERIYELLYERLNLVEESVGIHEPVLGSKLTDLQKEIIEGNLSDNQLEERCRSIDLAISQSKLEVEDFEAQRSQLLGDNEFKELLHGIESKSEFLKPSHSIRLSELFLDDYEGCKVKRIDEDTALFTLTNEMKALLESFTRKPGSEGSINELGPLLNQQSEIKVVFNGSTAIDRQDHLFLPPAGFWIKFLLDQLENKKEVYQTFLLSGTAEGTVLDQSDYLIPVFETELEGMKKEIQLAMVPIDLKNGDVLKKDYIQFCLHFSENIMLKNEEIDVNYEPSEEQINFARTSLEEFMEERLELIRKENETLSEARIQSLQKGAAIRIERLHQRIEDHKARNKKEFKEANAEYVRLIGAQIENEERRTLEKVNKIKSKAGVSLRMKLVACVLLKTHE